MVEIKAGAELDRAVAEAIGLMVMAKVLNGPDLFVDPRDGTPGALVEFHPSTDLNAAFAAAEKAGLFDVHWLGKTRTGWVVYEMDTGPISECDTASLAICAAILELAKGNGT